MPYIIYAFALSTFALGLSEFIVIGLAPSLAASFGMSVTEVGATVTAYAFGVCVGGALLTGLLSSWSSRRILLSALALFTVAHVAMAAAPTLGIVVAARFASGLAHGLFLAVASSAAAAAAGPEKGGRAVALVFSGLTVALVLGVPTGTFLDAITGWRPLLLAIAAISAAGWAALAWQLPKDVPKPAGHPFTLLKRAVSSRPIVMAALVTAATYSALFTVYTYIATLLKEVSGLATDGISAALLVFGGAAVAGNALGGMLRDRLGSYFASMVVVSALTLTLLATSFWMATPLMAYVLVAALGFVAFAAVSVFQSRIIEIAQRVAPTVTDVASGLNIAGFNLGIVMGSLVGGVVLTHWGVTHLATAALALAVVAMALLAVRSVQPQPATL